MKFTQPVAITGIGGIFPGAGNPGRFIEIIEKGIGVSREAPRGRWILSAADAYWDKNAPDRLYSLKGCFVDDFRLEDYIPDNFIRTDKSFLNELDPMYRIGLAAGVSAFLDSGPDNIDRARTGVILGNIALPTEKSSALSWEILGPTFEEKVTNRKAEKLFGNTHPLNRFVTGLPAGLLSAALGLKGGNFTLDAACASSLYAVMLACDELLSGRADAMITGGMSRPDSLYTQMGFSQLKALSRSGICSPFDYKADGLVMGEGAGMFVIKRLTDALKAGDKIYALIVGGGLSNDLGANLLAPDSEGQLRAMQEAYRDAGWTPDLVDLIECHGTGTPVGDGVEIESYRMLWKNIDVKPGACVVGSVKSNIGHLLTGAGAAGLMKVILSMEKGVLPPTANFEKPAPSVRLEGSPFRALSRSEPWNRRNNETPRRAAVSAFGFGGINAHLLTEEYIPEKSKTYPSAEPSGSSADIAVVGMQAHYGPWENLNSFKEKILSFGDDKNTPGKSGWHGADKSLWIRDLLPRGIESQGYPVDEIKVPLGRFRIPPNEMKEILPQQLLMLNTAYGALEDAGHLKDDHTHSGVFIGISLDMDTGSFHNRWALKNYAGKWADSLELELSADELDLWTDSLQDAFGPPLNANRTTGSLGGIVASRIAREFRFGGPSFVVSAEESSGLRAIETAVRMLRRGRIQSALAGAVDMAADIRSLLTRHSEGTLGANVPSFGEGSFAVVLKRLDDAVRDGDKIYAVIKGAGSSSAGDDNGLPSWKGAVEPSFYRALKDCPDEISGEILQEYAGPEAELNLTPLKINSLTPADSPGILQNSIGFSGAASGMASFIKACLCLYRRIIPSSKGNHSRYWLTDSVDGPRRASVTASGSDGSCTSVILESAGQNNYIDSPEPHEALFAVEGNTPGELIGGIDQLLRLTEANLHESIFRLACRWYNEKGQNSSLPLATTFTADSVDKLLQSLKQTRKAIEENPQRPLNVNERSIFSGFSAEGVHYAPNPLGRDKKLAFVYPGSGNHYAGMGRELCITWPQIIMEQENANRKLKSQMFTDLFWNSSPDPIRMMDDHNALIAGQVTFGTVVTDILEKCKIRPEAVLGYSLGETAGFFGMKVWKNRDRMLEKLRNTDLFNRQLGGSCMAARKAWSLQDNEEVRWSIGLVDAPSERVKEALKGRNRAYLLIINTPDESVVGGDRDEVDALVKDLGCGFFPLSGVTTVHCPILNQVKDQYRDFHLYESTPPDGISFYSTAWGRSYDITKDSAADAVLAQASDTIDFTRVVNQAYDDGTGIFIEIGPGASCSRMIERILSSKPHYVRSCNIPGKSETGSVLNLLAGLLAQRAYVDLSFLYGNNSIVEDKVIPSGKIMSFPTDAGEFILPQPPSGIVKKAPAIVAVGPDIAPTPINPVSSAMILNTDYLNKARQAASLAHEAFLRVQGGVSTAIAENLSLQMFLTQRGGRLNIQERKAPSTSGYGDFSTSSCQNTTISPFIEYTAPSKNDRPFMDRAQCMEFAIGSVGKVLGPEFEAIDSHPTRVRLPDEPLMLVDRILSVEGEAKSLTHGRVITEHDVKENSWYLDSGRIPTCIAVEAGQADLFLSGYLGIDFVTKGHAVYRLLDAVVEFHSPLPKAGSIIKYDIRILRFFRQGDTYLFKFQFDSTVNGRPLLTMRDGCAGFFSKRELDEGKGIIHTALDLRPIPGKTTGGFKPLVPMDIECYSDIQLKALREGRLSDAFGPAFENLPVRKPLTIPGGKMKLVDRIQYLNPSGGRFGLGLIRAEADIHPDDWFLTCHFSDDNVMPGTLMYECCMHALRVFLLRTGWIAEENENVFEPLPGIRSGLKCRGQVIETTKRAAYEISIKEIGYNPEPYVIADALMFADGRPVVEITDMSAVLSGTDKNRIEEIWKKPQEMLLRAERNEKAIYDNDSITAFAIGNPSEAFGDPYRVFDKDRIIARLPGPPYKFLDRITEVSGEPWKMFQGSSCTAQYDIPADEWYFNENRQNRMPFSVLLEVALQPCGWLAAYMGSALTGDEDLSFRNLGGEAVQLKEVAPETGTLTTFVECTNVSSSGGMIIQHYAFHVVSAEGPVYKGTTYFGFFSKEALKNQIGIRDAAVYAPSAREMNLAETFVYPEDMPYPGPMMRMLDHIQLHVPDGGPEGLGFIRGTLNVDPGAWFFKAHFYQDPVIPGSLGLESMIQLMKYAAYKRWPHRRGNAISMALGNNHRWVYRGQVIPTDKKVTVDCWITSADDGNGVLFADGFLSVDGRIIYQMNDFSLMLRNE